MLQSSTTMTLLPSPHLDLRRATHNKVRSGCVTCKKRHIKCDEIKPACTKCKKSGLRCGGYNTPKIWLFEVDKPSGSKSQSAEQKHSEILHVGHDRGTYNGDEDSLEFHPSLPTMATFAKIYMPHFESTYSAEDRPYISKLFEYGRSPALPTV